LTDSGFAEKEDLAVLERALRLLSTKQREVFIMAEIEQLTAAEIGDILTISPNTASSRLRAARQDSKPRAVQPGVRTPERPGPPPWLRAAASGRPVGLPGAISIHR
jgi:DNA-binding CsgD family transcriptional regulator